MGSGQPLQAVRSTHSTPGCLSAPMSPCRRAQLCGDRRRPADVLHLHRVHAPGARPDPAAAQGPQAQPDHHTVSAAWLCLMSVAPASGQLCGECPLPMQHISVHATDFTAMQNTFAVYNGGLSSAASVSFQRQMTYWQPRSPEASTESLWGRLLIACGHAVQVLCGALLSSFPGEPLCCTGHMSASC